MNTLFDSVSFGTVMELVVKVTALLGIASLAAWVLRRESAAVRHFVWALALGAALLLPVSAFLVPDLDFRLPSALTPAFDDQGFGGDSGSLAARTTSPTRGARTHEQGLPAGSPGDNAGAVGSGPVVRIDAARVRPSLWALWLAGAACVMLRLGVGHLEIARRTRGGAPLEGDTWRSLLDTAAARVGLATRVRLCSSPRIGAPVTWGFRLPVIALPASAAQWPVERRSMALAHELAHVARRDYVTQLGATIVCAVYWFHPFVWHAARRMRAEGEHACDDRVLASGATAPDYASQLLAIARHARNLRLAGTAAVCMARPSQLEGRLLALLDDARPRRALSTRARLAAVASIAALVVPFSALQPVTRAVAIPAEGTGERDERPRDKAGESRHQSVPAKPGERLTIDLETGAGIEVRGWDQDRVEVDVRLGGTDWRDTEVDIARQAGGVRIASRQRARNGTSSTSHDLHIRVPRRFDLQLQSAGGGVTIIDVEGNVRGQTGGGDIVLEHVKGDIRLSTGGGEIRVTDANARGFVRTGGGPVRMSRVRGGLRGDSGSGPVVYAEEGDASGDDRDSKYGDLDGVHIEDSSIEDGRVDARGMLHIERAGGDVVLPEAPHGARIMTGGGEIRVGRAGGDVEATTGGGDIDIGPALGSVIASTGAGAVHVELAAKDQSVEIAAGVGRVVVELPAGFDGTFDLETAYTESHRKATRIESGWTLEHETTTEWDDRHGTPRRYVRARGEAGKGRGSIRVRTVNGDIVVRRAGSVRDR